MKSKENSNIEVVYNAKNKEIIITYFNISNYLLLKLFTEKDRKPILKKILISKTGKECIDLMALRKKKYIIEIKGVNYKRTENILF